MPEKTTDTVIAPGHPAVSADPTILESLAASAESVPLRPGIITTRSYCCNAPVITVGRGLRSDICQACGKPHEPHRVR